MQTDLGETPVQCKCSLLCKSETSPHHYLKKTSDLATGELVMGLLMWYWDVHSEGKENGNPNLLQQLTSFEMPSSLFSSNWINNVHTCRACELKARLNITLLVIDSFGSHGKFWSHVGEDGWHKLHFSFLEHIPCCIWTPHNSWPSVDTGLMDIKFSWQYSERFSPGSN